MFDVKFEPWKWTQNGQNMTPIFIEIGQKFGPQFSIRDMLDTAKKVTFQKVSKKVKTGVTAISRK